jgi:hypothetical protein
MSYEVQQLPGLRRRKKLPKLFGVLIGLYAWSQSVRYQREEVEHEAGNEYARHLNLTRCLQRCIGGMRFFTKNFVIHAAGPSMHHPKDTLNEPLN